MCEEMHEQNSVRHRFTQGCKRILLPPPQTLERRVSHVQGVEGQSVIECADMADLSFL